MKLCTRRGVLISVMYKLTIPYNNELNHYPSLTIAKEHVEINLQIVFYIYRSQIMT